jgi:hypothetical protein
MKLRNKWLLFGGVVVVVATFTAYLGYEVIWSILDIKRMESQRPILLYQTDHRALLKACREFSKRITSGEIEVKYNHTYYRHSGDLDPEKKLFTKPILDLAPSQVYVENTGLVVLVMSPVILYGVRAYPEGIKGGYYDDDIELIPGLWYFDADLKKHPEHKKEIEELLKKRKAGDSSSGP